jgi:hypothetical protein
MMIHTVTGVPQHIIVEKCIVVCVTLLHSTDQSLAKPYHEGSRKFFMQKQGFFHQ